MNEMISEAKLSLDEIVKHFLEKGHLRNSRLQDKMKQIIGLKGVRVATKFFEDF